MSNEEIERSIQEIKQVLIILTKTIRVDGNIQVNLFDRDKIREITTKWKEELKND